MISTKEIKVEKRVKIPPRPRPSRTCRYPFARMEVNDSFSVPAPKDSKGATKVQSAIGASARNFAKTHKGFRITTRRAPEGGSIRCWRIA